MTAPDGSSQEAPLQATSPGHYEARISTQQQGLYRIASADPALQLPATGFYREIEEMKPREVNVDLLSRISNLTGGRVFPTTAQLLDDNGSLVRERRAAVALLAGPCAASEFHRGGMAKRPFRPTGFAVPAQAAVFVSTPSVG